ncbi:MFS transporter [Gemmobacter serpentinus]|uniref:MFS transporter n=1 Tax=Gemmobacter serpentinus TaxID=2652247 RepID=UPI00124F3F38|nr:MFS transporter [Gemmobacter serpentinus]
MGQVSDQAPAATPMAAAAPGGILAGMGVAAALPYFLAAIVIGLAQGLGQGFVSANIPQIAGDLGVSTTEASWLMAAYMVPRATLPLMLIKLRTQFGLRRFAEVSILVFTAVAFAALWISDLRSAVVVQFLSGCAAAPLSTLAFLYMLEPLAPQAKMRFGLPAVMAIILIGPNLARVISPSLIGDGGLAGVHFAGLGLALISLAVVWYLPLNSPPREKVIERGDFLSFGLISLGFAGITIGAVMGPIRWWTDAPWIGALLAISIAALALAVMIELARKSPLVDFRWLATPAMLHLTVTLLLFRLVLSEQSTGAPRMFQVLGLAPSQMEALFAVICIAAVMGGLACVAWMKPGREAAFHAVALTLIAAAAYMDAQSTIDTRPEQFLISQAMIGFASMLFMPPAMMMGLLAAMRKGQNYLLSFIIVFIATQSLGAVIGSGLFTTLTTRRQAFHLATLTEQLQMADPLLQSTLARGTALMATQNPDLAADRLQVMSQLLTQAGQQAWVMAYNDAYFLTFLTALAALAALLLHVLRDWLWRRWTPQPVPPASAAPDAGAQNRT